MFGLNTSSSLRLTYFAVDPNARLSMLMTPAKSRMTPSCRQIPTWPTKGTSQAMIGSGTHTRQYGNLPFFTSTVPCGAATLFTTCKGCFGQLNVPQCNSDRKKHNLSNLMKRILFASLQASSTDMSECAFKETSTDCTKGDHVGYKSQTFLRSTFFTTYELLMR